MTYVTRVMRVSSRVVVANMERLLGPGRRVGVNQRAHTPTHTGLDGGPARKVGGRVHRAGDEPRPRFSVARMPRPVLVAGADPGIRDSKHDSDAKDWARFFR